MSKESENRRFSIGEQKKNDEFYSYFKSPRDIDRFSKWPKFARLSGSVLPHMIVPLVFIACWATAMRCVSVYVHSIAINQVLLTVLAFIISLALSFRCSTAYERYSQGRQYWQTLNTSIQVLGRVFWVHALERPENSKADILFKKSGLNLLAAFAISLKHRLRIEPYTNYPDLDGFLAHLDTYAGEASRVERPAPPKTGLFKVVGQCLGFSFCYDNPLRPLKTSDMALGNLPLEILAYLAAFVDTLVADQMLKVPMQHSVAYNTLTSLHDVLTGCDRILGTPLTIAYTIAIHQITWLYVMLLPFQLDATLGWIAIPATVLAAYIILSILLIGSQLENPFGNDVNDLPLDNYCRLIATDLDILSSRPRPNMRDLVQTSTNQILFPVSGASYDELVQEDESHIRSELKHKGEVMSKHRKFGASTRRNYIKDKFHHRNKTVIQERQIV